MLSVSEPGISAHFTRLFFKILRFHILSLSQQGFQPLAEVDAAVLQAESGAEGTGRVIVSVAAVVEDKSNILAVESSGIEAAIAYLLIGKTV